MSSPRASPHTQAAANRSPAPVVSTAATSTPGSVAVTSCERASAPSAPRVMTTTSAHSASAAAAANTSSRSVIVLASTALTSRLVPGGSVGRLCPPCTNLAITDGDKRTRPHWYEAHLVDRAEHPLGPQSHEHIGIDANLGVVRDHGTVASVGHDRADRSPGGGRGGYQDPIAFELCAQEPSCLVVTEREGRRCLEVETCGADHIERASPR